MMQLDRDVTVHSLAGFKPKETVVVVDDDRGMRETVIDILELAGIHADGAASAETARSVINDVEPSLVIVDQRLPDASGIELGAELKIQDPDRPVLLLTGYATMENAIEAVGKVDDYLVKPIQPEQLVKAIRDGLEKHRLRQQNRHLLNELSSANMALEESVIERTTELTGLVIMAEAIARSPGIAEVITATVQTICTISESRSAALYLFGEGDSPNILHLAATHGDVWQLPKTVPEEDSRSNFLNPDPYNQVETVLLEAGNIQSGILLLRGPERSSDVFIKTLATQIAVAIQNSQRFERERETVERLSELSQMENMFLASVSHELRTPLTAVIGFARMLEADNGAISATERAEMVGHIATQGERLSHLVNDVLDATRLESRRFTVARNEVSLIEAIHHSVESVMSNNHEIVVEFPDDIPSVVGDAQRIEQVIGNLLQNAVKYSSPSTSIVISVDVDTDLVSVSVADQGPGIDPSFLSRAFESFTQAETGNTKRGAGLGLGLYITKGLVDAMSGSIEVVSEVGKGSTFVVKLPRA